MSLYEPDAAGAGQVLRSALGSVSTISGRLATATGVERGAVAPGRGSIDEVIVRMTMLGARLEAERGANDGVLWFNRLYLEVTKAVGLAVRQPGFFADPGMIAELDVIFAQLYFEAVDAADRHGQASTLAWKALLRSRGDSDILPIQFALAGMNAHINHDLPIALVQQWTRHGKRASGNGAAFADFEKINQILKREESILKRSFEPPLLRELDAGQLGALEDKLSLWVVADARARAWRTGQHLWSLRHLPPLRAVLLAAVDVRVGLLGRALLEPV
jgi:hypothetical protein